MNVFISYRRQDDLYLPAHLRALLGARLPGSEIFFDIDNIPVGVDFGTHLRTWLARSDVVLALIGPNWRPELLHREQDFVRFELLGAHDLGKVIVPVLHGERSMPSTGELPVELHWLARIQAFTIGPPPNHVTDVQRLVEVVAELDQVITSSADPAREAASPPTAPPRHGSLDFMNELDQTAALRKRLRRLIGG